MVVCKIELNLTSYLSLFNRFFVEKMMRYFSVTHKMHFLKLKNKVFSLSKK